MRYWPALDGLRGLAVLAVMLFHAQVPQVRGGFLGVDIFFVLSGFLITSQLLREVHIAGRIRWGRFFIRRLIRLQPALLVTPAPDRGPKVIVIRCSPQRRTTHSRHVPRRY